MTEKNPFEEISTPIDNHFYKLVNQEPVPCSLEEYAKNMQVESNRIIKQTEIKELLVSTIFTGIDYSFGSAEKKLFETIIFGLDEEIHPKWQNATWNSAIEKHHELIQMIENEDINLIKQKIQDAKNN